MFACMSGHGGRTRGSRLAEAVGDTKRRTRAVAPWARAASAEVHRLWPASSWSLGTAALHRRCARPVGAAAPERSLLAAIRALSCQHLVSVTHLTLFMAASRLGEGGPRWAGWLEDDPGP